MKAWLAGVAFVVVVIAITGTSGLTAGSRDALVPPKTANLPAAPYVTISEDGVSPTGLSIVATASGIFCGPAQQVWTIYESIAGSHGPWRELSSLTIAAYRVVEGVSNLVPGATYWWYAADTNTCTGIVKSNTLELTQPAVATLSYSLETPSSATLKWNNLAVYGGQIVFGSYTVDQAIDHGNWTPITTITNVSSTAYNISGLAPGTDYAFEINTTDVISGTNSSSVSNEVMVNVSSASSSPATSGGLSFGDWAVIGLLAALAALMAAMVLAVRRKSRPPKIPVKVGPSERPGPPHSPPSG